MMDMRLFSFLVIGKGPTPALAWESGSPGARLRAVCDLDDFPFVGKERPGRRASGRQRRLCRFCRSCWLPRPVPVLIFMGGLANLRCFPPRLFAFKENHQLVDLFG